MNVLHILDHSVPLFSGYSFRTQSIVRFQQAAGIKPVILTSPKQGSLGDEVEEIDSIRYYRTQKLNEGRTARTAFIREIELMRRMASRIAGVVQAEKIEIIHSHSPSLNGLPALWVSRRFGLPLVYEARAFWEDAAVDHGTFRERSFRYRVSQGLETFLFKKADRVVTICEGMRKELIERGIDPARIKIFPNGVDLERFNPQACSSRLTHKFSLNGNPVFGFIGSFYHYEGLEFLIMAFTKIINQIPGARLLMVGGGVEEQHLRRIAKSLGSAVIFAGQVPQEEIRDFYSIVDVFVYPRRRIRLTELVTPLKPLESMAMAKTVLASDVGGLKELIQHDATGFLFPAENPDAFVAEAVRTGGDPGLQARIGTAARRYVESQRSWPQIVAGYMPLYEELLTERSARGGRPSAAF